MQIKGMKNCIFYYVTVLANLVLLVTFLFVFADGHGEERYLALMVCLPPFLALYWLYKAGDREERILKRKIRKAALRKELDALKAFDKD